MAGKSIVKSVFNLGDEIHIVLPNHTHMIYHFTPEGAYLYIPNGTFQLSGEKLLLVGRDWIHTFVIARVLSDLL